MTGVQTCALPICFPVTISFTAGTVSLTLNSSITCDILVVAGGGGGGGRAGGGGGAGAVIYLTNQTLSSGIYSITIGAGGTKGGFNGSSGNDTSISLGGMLVIQALVLLSLILLVIALVMGQKVHLVQISLVIVLVM